MSESPNRFVRSVVFDMVLRKKVEEAKEAGKFGVTGQRIQNTNLKPPRWRPKYTKETMTVCFSFNSMLREVGLNWKLGVEVAWAPYSI